MEAQILAWSFQWACIGHMLTMEAKDLWALETYLGPEEVYDWLAKEMGCHVEGRAVNAQGLFCESCGPDCGHCFDRGKELVYCLAPAEEVLGQTGKRAWYVCAADWDYERVGRP